jgi:tRNA threonylcarbamoyladenosine biosynthesis protein TsaE
VNCPIIQRELPNEERLEAFAASFASASSAPLVVYLIGNLGAGKTTFVRAFIRALGYSGRVKSPTYGLMERYDFQSFKCLHLDLYRLENEAELDFLALRDLLDEHTVLLVEWPDRGGKSLPPADVELKFSESITQRSLSLVPASLRGESVVARLSE